MVTVLSPVGGSLATGYIWWVFSGKDTRFHQKWDRKGREPLNNYSDIEDDDTDETEE